MNPTLLLFIIVDHLGEQIGTTYDSNLCLYLIGISSIMLRELFCNKYFILGNLYFFSGNLSRQIGNYTHFLGNYAQKTAKIMHHLKSPFSFYL